MEEKEFDGSIKKTKTMQFKLVNDKVLNLFAPGTSFAIL